MKRKLTYLTILIGLIHLGSSCQPNESQIGNYPGIDFRAEAISWTKAIPEFQDDSILMVNTKLEITNNTDSLFVFHINNCSWYESFETDHEYIWIPGFSCDANFTAQVNLAKSETFRINATLMTLEEDKFTWKEKFRIKLVVISEYHIIDEDFDKLTKDAKSQANFLISNEVNIKNLPFSTERFNNKWEIEEQTANIRYKNIASWLGAFQFVHLFSTGGII